MDKATQTMIENLHKNTGKTLEQWIEIVKKENFAKHGDTITFLKNTHNLTHGFANLIAHKAKGSDADSTENKDDLIGKQYKGKEHFKPLYDKLLDEIQMFGRDFEIAPKNAYVSLRRKKQFAILQPATIHSAGPLALSRDFQHIREFHSLNTKPVSLLNNNELLIFIT